MQQKEQRGFFDAPTGRKFWVLIYVVPWFIVGFLSALFLRNNSTRSAITATEGREIGFSWGAVPWRSNSALKNQLIANYPITIHGTLHPQIESIYKAAANISDPLYTSITSSCISHEGFVVHSGKEYPSEHKWFPPFSLNNFSKFPRDNAIYPRVISLPQPPGMSDYFFISNIFPLLFTLPQDLISSSIICFTSISPALQQFLEEVHFNVQVVTTVAGTVCAEEIIIPQLPSENAVPQSADFLFTDMIVNEIPKEYHSIAMIMRYGDKEMRRRELITKKLIDISENYKVMDKQWTIWEQICALSNSKIAIGFGGDQLNLALFMRPGSTIVEIQRDNVISRPVLTARALGFRVHVITVRDGDVISDSVLDTLLRIIQNSH